MKAKFVIIDPGLNRLGGHNYTLAMAFSDAAHAIGHDVLWLCHKQFPSELAPSHIRAEKVFPLSYYKKSKFRWHAVRVHDRLADWIGNEPPPIPATRKNGCSPPAPLVQRLSRQVRPFVKEMAAALKKFHIGPADHAFVTTAEYLQYAALLELLSAEDGEDLPHFHVRTSFDESFLLNKRFGSRLPHLFRRFRDLGLAGRRIFFYAETPELATHFQNWNLVPFEVLGNPVPQQLLKPPAHANNADTDKTLTIVFPGQARSEKGYLRLPPIVANLLAREDISRPVRFVLQSYLRKADTGGRVRGKDRDRGAARDALKAFPGLIVQVVERTLTNDEYYALVAGADILLLPYDADIYRTRPSMIASEAALFGKPVVVTAGTTLAEFVEPGTGETALTDAEFADGLARIVNDYDTYRAKAEARAVTIRHELDPRVLVRRMVALAGAAAHDRACVG